MTRLAKRYQLDAPIGQGGMGTVFKGRDIETGEWIAAKRLKPEAVKADPQLLERFAREGDALRRLNHPNIVKMLTTIEQDGDHYIVLEYVGGGDLGDMLKARGRLSIERTLQIGIELSDALTRAHYLNIIHRDIKPANVLMGEDGVPKLTDFGVAHIGGLGGGDITGAGLAMGTPDYMSPESVNGEEVDERADIWSLGVMLYEMLGGQHPFRGEALTATLINILTQPPHDLETLRPETPIALLDLIGRMLHKDRASRISSVRLVGAELEAIMRGRSDSRRTTVTTPISLPAVDESRFETPTPPTSAPKHNLPAQTTAFVGREAELEDISRLLGQSDTRLITLLGQGGMGKTRLAIHAAEVFLHAFEHGVYFVGLASLPNADGISGALADAVGYAVQTDGRDPAQQIIDYLREKAMLVVFDNFEQVLSGVTFVSDLLRAAPRLKVMVTSRERLNLTGENIVALGGLDFPDASNVADAMRYSAVQLFVQSARRAAPSFELTEADLRHIARICRSVDGLPLGVVLAASWTDSLSVVEIADEITRSLDFLESELRDLPARHRSMRAVFDYSWNLLSETEREAFIKLSIFRGGFTREAAQAATGASLRNLTNLQNKSLLRRNPDTGRYEIHELVRQYAFEKLQADPTAYGQAKRAHAEYYTDFLVKRGDVYMSNGQELKILSEIESERDNIRATWTYAIECDRLPLLAQSMHIVAMFFEAKGLSQEGSSVFHEIAESVAALPQPDPVLIARAKVYAAHLEVFLGDYNHATADANEALKTFSERELHGDIGKAHNVLAYVAMNQGRYEDARHHLELSVAALSKSEHKHAFNLVKRGEATLAYVMFLQGEYAASEALYRRIIEEGERGKWSPYVLSYQYNNLGEVLHEQGRDDEARPLIQKALGLFDEVKNQRWQAVALVNLGMIEHSASRYAVAESYFRRALKLYKEIGDRRGIGEALNRLGGTVYWYGKYQEALEFNHKAYELFSELGNPKGAADALVLCAMAENALGKYDAAREHLDAAFEIRGRLGNMADIADVQQILAINAIFRRDYDVALQYIEQSYHIAQSMTDDGTARFRFLVLSGMAYADAGQFDKAIPVLEEGLSLKAGHGMYWALAQGLALLGHSYISTDRVDEGLAMLRQSLEHSVRIRTHDWAMLAVAQSSWAIALRGNPINGVEYISYVMNSPNSQKYIMDRVQFFLDRIRPLLTEPEFAVAWERGKTLTYEDVVAGVLGRPVKVE